MSYKLELNPLNLMDMLSFIKKSNKNGILAIEKTGTGNYALYFKEGNLIYVRRVDKIFGIYLEIDFNQVLLKENLTKEELYTLSLFRLQEILNLKKGFLSFSSGFIKYDDYPYKYISIEKIIMYLSRKLTKEDLTVIDDEMIFYKPIGYENLVKIAYLTINEEYILNFVDGKRTVKDIINISKKQPYIVKRALYGMYSAGIIKIFVSEKEKNLYIKNLITNTRENPNLFENFIKILSNLEKYQKKKDLKEVIEKLKKM
ncbi:hypothetical protein JCM14244_14390 [Venenivibrio stagnispumantis]|uniref:PatA-like N-terminal domain-containing protein n=1 Tax=Venenivibrio stagnispumantis TaxID=407998 RepID=A0AA45WL18_9AQUI|nr:DUF4388 domain-containing protein [Venenivibrio stagnispumantis]MCW4573673.1 DUF4388 domain-containing protein [Venenivibrio stagnispumantis]SMP09840.1 protein of unknown function [Venenivibrio stagnispumantis]